MLRKAGLAVSGAPRTALDVGERCPVAGGRPFRPRGSRNNPLAPAIGWRCARTTCISWQRIIKQGGYSLAQMEPVAGPPKTKDGQKWAKATGANGKASLLQTLLADALCMRERAPAADGVSWGLPHVVLREWASCARREGTGRLRPSRALVYWHGYMRMRNASRFVQAHIQ